MDIHAIPPPQHTLRYLQTRFTVWNRASPPFEVLVAQAKLYVIQMFYSRISDTIPNFMCNLFRVYAFSLTTVSILAKGLEYGPHLAVSVSI